MFFLLINRFVFLQWAFATAPTTQYLSYDNLSVVKKIFCYAAMNLSHFKYVITGHKVGNITKKAKVKRNKTKRGSIPLKLPTMTNYTWRTWLLTWFNKNNYGSCQIQNNQLLSITLALDVCMFADFAITTKP